MNVGRIYVAQIYVIIEQKQEEGFMCHRKGTFVKNALVYHDDYNKFIDMISGEKYETDVYCTDCGDMYVNLKNGLMPIKWVLDVSFERQDMSKRKILKRINKAILLKKKEEDDK